MKNILLIQNKIQPDCISMTQKVVDILSANGCHVYCQNIISNIIKSPILSPIDDLYSIEKLDSILVVGGDGSILSAGKIALYYDVPIIGINIGKLGYLAEIEISSIDSLNQIIQDKYQIKNIPLLQIEHDQNVYYAVNEVAITRGNQLHILDINMYVKNESIHYRSDGIIVSSPTGSTAYSLSAGGPIIDSEINVLTVTPICPHSFFDRSIVFGSHSTITLENNNFMDFPMLVAVDGQESFILNHHEQIHVKYSDKHLKVITLNKISFIEKLKEKMNVKDSCQ